MLLFFGIVAFCSAFTPDEGGRGNPSPEKIAIRENAVGVVSHWIKAEARSAANFQKWVKEIEGAPVYQRISAARAAVEFLGDATPVSFEGAAPQKGSHDLLARSGRAAVIIETAMGIRLNPIVDASKMRKGEVYDSVFAKGIIASFTAGAIAIDRERWTPGRRMELKERFAGKIRFGITEYKNGGAPFAEDIKTNTFLREWFPIDKSFKELEAYFGPPEMRKGNVAFYHVDNGYGMGCSYRFHLDGDRIDFVEVDTEID